MDYREAYAKALKLLNVRFLSEGELRQKLRQRKVDDEVIDEVVETFKGEHFLDDDRRARAVYAYYAKKEQYGHRYIVQRLQKRALPVPEDLERVDEYVVAERIVEKKFPGPDRDYAKAARYLQYRGFAVSVIRDVLA